MQGHGDIAFVSDFNACRITTDVGCVTIIVVKVHVTFGAALGSCLTRVVANRADNIAPVSSFTRPIWPSAR